LDCPCDAAAVLVLPLVLGIAGCTQLASINDPYIKAMKADPMFSWEPPTAVTRKVIYFPRDATYERTSYSSVVVWLTPSDPQAVPELLQAAKDARTRSGYSEGDRRLGGKNNGADFWINCDVSANQYKPGATENPVETSPLTRVQIQLDAPTWSRDSDRTSEGPGRREALNLTYVIASMLQTRGLHLSKPEPSSNARAVSDLGGSPYRHGIGMGTREGRRHSYDWIPSHTTSGGI
jgi:hypothetical protein